MSKILGKKLVIVEGLGLVPANPAAEVGDESIEQFETAMADAEKRIHGAPDAKLAKRKVNPYPAEMAKVKPQWPTYMDHVTDGGAGDAPIPLDEG